MFNEKYCFPNLYRSKSSTDRTINWYFFKYIKKIKSEKYKINFLKEKKIIKTFINISKIILTYFLFVLIKSSNTLG